MDEDIRDNLLVVNRTFTLWEIKVPLSQKSVEGRSTSRMI